MNDAEILDYVKFNLGLTTDLRDKYLLQIIKGARAELKESGIDPEGQSDSYIDNYDNYLADYAAYMYRNRGGEAELPRHLLFRRRNLIISHV